MKIKVKIEGSFSGVLPTASYANQKPYFGGALEYEGEFQNEDHALSIINQTQQKLHAICFKNFQLELEKAKEEAIVQSEFPEHKSNYLKAENFQDQEVLLTFIGWDKKGNEDTPAKGTKSAVSWKQKIKYQLRYSYPEWARDEVGENILDKNGNPFRNRYWDMNYPQGYSILYHFDEGIFETGSLPLFVEFCNLRPLPGERIILKRTGKDKETQWFLRKASNTSSKKIDLDELPSIQLDETPE